MKLSLAILKGIAIGAALIAVASLTSCAGYPIKARIVTEYGTADFSKSGMTFQPSGLPIVIREK